MQKTQRTFTREFKVEAVRLLQASQKPLAQVARDLGMPTVRYTIGENCSPCSESRRFRGVDI